MNEKRRDGLRIAISHLNSALTIARSSSEKERDCIDNMPENLQDTDRVDLMENAADMLDNAVDNIEEAIVNIKEAIA